MGLDGVISTLNPSANRSTRAAIAVILGRLGLPETLTSEAVRAWRHTRSLPLGPRVHLPARDAPQTSLGADFPISRRVWKSPGQAMCQRCPQDQYRRCMRAFAVRNFGEPPGLVDIQSPSLGGEFVLRVSCAGVNPVDLQLVDQLTSASAFPFVLGVDVAGVAESVPGDQQAIHVGDRVFGMARTHGSYAEYTAVAPGVRTEPLARIPDGISNDQAAALPVAGLAALGSLELLGLVAGQWLVITGATGAVGGYATQMARARGVRVVATVRGEAREAYSLGAEQVIDVKDVDMPDAVREARPEGVDGVLDIVNGRDSIRRNLGFLKPGGTLVSTVYGADVNWFALHQVTAYNIVGHGAPPEGTPNPMSSPQALNQLAQMVSNGTITPRITTTVELESAGQVLKTLGRGGLRGKAIIRV